MSIRERYDAVTYLSALTAELALEFGSGGNGSAMLGSGWSTPERDETWTCAPKSSLTLPVPTARATYVLVLKLRPQLVVGRLEGQRLGVAVNGVEIDEFVITRRTARACLIPWSLLRDARSLDIVFTMPDAARPADLGASSDQRLLGVAMSSLVLYPSLHDEWESSSFGGSEPVQVDVASIMAADQLPLNQLMMKFESLGQNCEFGLVQRQCQAEPLGLLRFSSTPIAQLLVALENRFEGMGSPGTISVEMSSNGREYMVKDAVFGFLYHAWVKTGEMTPDEVRVREERRVPFLIRKLLEDLETGEKTFVFKGMGPMMPEVVFPLSAAIRRYGPNTLLFVNVAGEHDRIGTVEASAPGFLTGYVSRFAPADKAADLALSEWVRVCRDAYRMRLASLQ